MAKKKSPPRNGRPDRQPATSDVIELTLERHVPDDVRATYANHFVINGEQSVFHLLCYQADPPMLVGTPEQMKLQAKGLSVKAECVSHLVIPAHVLPSLLSAIQETVQKLTSGQTTTVKMTQPKT